MLDTLLDDLIANESDNWEAVSLLEIANYKNGLAMQRFRPVGDGLGLPVLKIRELGADTAGTTLRDAAAISTRPSPYMTETSSIRSLVSIAAFE